MTGPKAKVGQPAPHWRGKAVVQDEIKEIQLDDYKVRCRPCHQSGTSDRPCQQLALRASKGQCSLCAQTDHCKSHDCSSPFRGSKVTPSVNLIQDGMHLTTPCMPFTAWLPHASGQHNLLHAEQRFIPCLPPNRQFMLKAALTLCAGSVPGAPPTGRRPMSRLSLWRHIHANCFELFCFETLALTIASSIECASVEAKHARLRCAMWRHFW